MFWKPKNENSPFYSLPNWWNNVVKPGVKSIWNDITGQSAVESQNAAQLELAKYQTQMQEDFYNKYSSPEALMRQYKEAGLNPNLVYGSASSGQGNVPSFNAPQVQRNVPGADKVNKALSMLSAISGVTQGIYQATAAREAAQQSAIKTANDEVSYRRNALDYIFHSDLLGLSIGSFRRRSIPIHSVYSDIYNRYLGEYRANQFNTWLRSGMLNQYDFGGNALSDGSLHFNNSFVPYYSTRNKTSWLKYDLMNELGNKGVYGKLAISLLGTLF